MDLSQLKHLWDGSEPGWRLGGPQGPIVNVLTSKHFLLEDCEEQAALIQEMLAHGVPQASTPEELAVLEEATRPKPPDVSRFKHLWDGTEPGWIVFGSRTASPRRVRARNSRRSASGCPRGLGEAQAGFGETTTVAGSPTDAPWNSMSSRTSSNRASRSARYSS